MHPSRAGDLQALSICCQAGAAALNYQDGFDNTITRVDVPAGVGSVRFTNHAVVADSGPPTRCMPTRASTRC